MLNQKLLHIFQNFKNNIDFFLRNKFSFSRKNYFERNEAKSELFSSEELAQREKVLYEKYDLAFLKENSTVENYLQNLYTIDVLDKYLAPSFNFEKIPYLGALDVGCKNWFYAKGEYAFFQKFCDNLNLDGIELDANRLYFDFYARVEVAKFYTKGLKNAKFITGDFLKHNKKYNYIVWILPFVVESPLLKWGLPKKYFQPEKMLLHAFDSLEDGGTIFIINQGEFEYEAQKSLCDKLNIPYIDIGEVNSEFYDFQHKRYGLLIKK